MKKAILLTCLLRLSLEGVGAIPPRVMPVEIEDYDPTEYRLYPNKFVMFPRQVTPEEFEILTKRDRDEREARYTATDDPPIYKYIGRYDHTLRWLPVLQIWFFLLPLVGIYPVKNILVRYFRRRNGFMSLRSGSLKNWLLLEFFLTSLTVVIVGLGLLIEFEREHMNTQAIIFDRETPFAAALASIPGQVLIGTTTGGLLFGVMAYFTPRLTKWLRRTHCVIGDVSFGLACWIVYSVQKKEATCFRLGSGILPIWMGLYCLTIFAMAFVKDATYRDNTILPIHQRLVVVGSTSQIQPPPPPPVKHKLLRLTIQLLIFLVMVGAVMAPVMLIVEAIKDGPCVLIPPIKLTLATPPPEVLALQRGRYMV